MDTTTPKTSTPQLLMPRDERILSTVAFYKFMTAPQIQRLLFPKAKPSTFPAARRLTELSSTYDETTASFLDGGYLSYDFLYDKATPRMGRPLRAFFITAANLHTIAEAYKRRGKYSTYKETFADVEPVGSRKGLGWSPHTTRHELAITDYGLAFHEGAKDKATILFWERTSPKSEDITCKYRVTKPDPTDENRTRAHVVNFNPDEVTCTLGELEGEKQRLFLSTDEIDRDTEDPAEILPKIYAYDEFIKERHSEKLLAYYTERYNLTAKYPFLASVKNHTIHFRVRFITTNTERRNDLIRLIARYSRFASVYHVTTFDQLDNWQAFYTGSFWYPASDYKPIFDREKIETKHMRQHARNQWAYEQIATHLSPVPYFYRARAQKEATP